MKPYEYRRLSLREREEVVQQRQAQGLPRHMVPHIVSDTHTYLITAACYEHAHFLATEARRVEFEAKLLGALDTLEEVELFAWCVLPNHYHFVVKGDLAAISTKLHRLHNGTSTGWNREDGVSGRQVWYRFHDKSLRTNRLFHRAVLYVHSNAVKHGYVRRAHEWPSCSASWAIEQWGRDEMRRLWRDYAPGDFGKDWDD